MTREEALELLRGGPEGIAEWNRYRSENKGAIPDLSEADLRGIDLSGLKEGQSWRHHVATDLFETTLHKADLSEANLSRANLARTDLSEANLSGTELSDAMIWDANLSRANLQKANFRSAVLVGANLSCANLRGARFNEADLSLTNLPHVDLTGGRLRGTRLFGAILQGANLKHVTVGHTFFSGVDLSGARNLDTLVHLSPSTVGLDTILMSGGEIPDEFLRGSGYDPQLQPIVLRDYQALVDAAYGAARPLRLQSCFISYSTRDKKFVDRLQKALNKRGVEYWYAPEHGEWGKGLRTQIDRAITLRDRVLLVCSRNSLTDSDWVQWEIDKAFAEEKRRGREVLFPIMIDDAVLTWDHPRATRVREILVGDFRNATKGRAFQEKVEKLIRHFGVDEPTRP